MTREIEFRVFYNQRGEMLYAGDFHPDQGFLMHNKEWSLICEEGEICGNEYATLMQYTGLRDKNGKKIFEGDIVIQEDTESVYEIKWHKEEAGFYMNSTNDYTTIEAEYLEVIGNIYENEELIE